MAVVKSPAGMSAGGRKLWREITAQHEGLDASQLVQLEEACRVKDRLDALQEVLSGPVSEWPRGAATHSVNMANLLKQLIAAMRLPDESGKRSTARTPRGAQLPSVPGGAAAVSSLERARARKSS